APLGATSLPSIISGSANVALKACPVWLALDPSVSPRRTVRTVPAGTMVGPAIAPFAPPLVAVAPDFMPPALLAVVLVPLAVLAFAGCSLFELPLQPINVNKAAAVAVKNKRRIVFFLSDFEMPNNDGE